MSLINRILNPRTTHAASWPLASAVFNDPFFNDPFFRSVGSNNFAAAGSLNAMDLQETDQNYLVNLDVPGYQKDQIEISAEGNTVSIKGNWKTSSEEAPTAGQGNYLHRERAEGSFVRSFTLDGFDSDNITAQLKDGVLSVTLPKKSEKETKKIPIA